MMQLAQVDAHPRTLDVGVFAVVQPGRAEHGRHGNDHQEPRHADLEEPRATTPRLGLHETPFQIVSDFRQRIVLPPSPCGICQSDG
jgi:hypothetical protein